MVVWFSSGMGTSRSSGKRQGFTNDQGHQQMHRCAPPGTLARRPDASTQRVDGVGAPVQTDTVVGFRRLGRESFFEYPLEILRGNADTVVLELQVQLLMLSLARDLGAHSQYALCLARIAHRVRGVDDEVLQDQAQHGARHTYHTQFA